MTNERDRGLVREATKRWPRRWRGLTAEFKDQVVEDLKTAREMALKTPATVSDPLNGAKVLISIAKTAAMMEGQHQADDLAQDKNDRLDTGKSTDNQTVRVVHVNRLHAPEAIDADS